MASTARLSARRSRRCNAISKCRSSAGLDGHLAVVSTGKLDIFSTVIPVVVLIYKGGRLWRGRGPEISLRMATGLVLGYFLFFPIDLWVLSRTESRRRAKSALYAALLAAIHLMLFATLVRLLFGAHQSRLRVSGGAGGHIHAGVGDSHRRDRFPVALAIFLVLAVSTFVALEIRRSANDAVSPAFEAGSPLAHQHESRARTDVGAGRHRHAAHRHRVFFHDSALHHRLPERAQSAAETDDRLQRRRRARRNRRNPTEQRGRHAHPHRRRSRARRRTFTGAASCSPISMASAGSPAARTNDYFGRRRRRIHLLPSICPPAIPFRCITPC